MNEAKELSVTRSFQKKDEDKYYLVLKRLLDIILSVLGIALLSPVFLLIGLIIKLEDKNAPVIFKQVRVGKGEKEFKMLKFRTMVSNAEELLNDLLQHNEVKGAMFKMKEDPRVTPVGKFLRKTSLDELPQLFNVLFGQMSLVGPRPPLPRETLNYTDYDKLRLVAQPGCTGLWQISGRSNVSFETMVKMDLEYINNRTILYDIKIIFKTIGVLFGSKDAF